jgi:predicted RNase H-like HicB family nuclease
MKPLNEYTIVTIPDDNGTFVAHIPAIQGCHAWGETPEQARAELQNVFDMITEEFQEVGRSLPQDVPPQSANLPSNKVDYLASLIKSLTEEERQELIKALHPNQYFKEKLNEFVITPQNTIIDFTFNDTDFKIFTLNDHDHRRLSKYFIALNFSYCFNPTFWRTSNRIFNGGWWQDSSDTKIISHRGFIYWILSYLFGESSPIVYKEKSTFIFRFYLEVTKQDNTYPYSFTIFDYGDCVEFSFYRCSQEEVTSTAHHQKPNEAEFSADEIDNFIIYFLGYLLGKFQLVEKQVTPFQRVIPSNGFVYGYSQENGFFEYEQECGERL